MEKKINIAEILKDCPTGMELGCTMFDDVYFDKVSDDKKACYPILCYITDEKGNRSSISFTKNGCESMRYGAKCVIFPKGKTTWEGFVPPCQFKDGDIVTYKYENSLVSMILNKFVNFVEVHYHCALYDNAKGFVTNNYIVGEPKYTCFATEEEKQKLFDAIKDNGYKWNAEAKTFEKLVEPIFKVGDIIIPKDSKNESRVINAILDNEYNLFGGGKIPFINQDNYELVPNKFNISTLKAFDKVLVRHNKDNKWCGSFFSHVDEDLHSHCYKFVTIAGKSYPMCIPYENNKHLLGTTDDCDEYYKTW